MADQTKKIDVRFSHDTIHHVVRSISVAQKKLQAPEAALDRGYAAAEEKSTKQANAIYERNSISLPNDLFSTFVKHTDSASQQAYDELLASFNKLCNRTILKPSVEENLALVRTDIEETEEKCELFLKAQKEYYFKNFPDNKTRKQLWNLYCKNTREKVLDPVSKFKQAIDPDRLLSQAFINHQNGLSDQDRRIITTYTDVKTEQFNPVGHFRSDGKDIHIFYNKDGKAKSLRVELSPDKTTLVNNLSDAFGALIASHGQNKLIKLELPLLAQTNVLDSHLSGIPSLLARLSAFIWQQRGITTYKQVLIQVAIKTGVKLEQLSLTDAAINFTDQDKEYVKQGQLEWQRISLDTGLTGLAEGTTQASADDVTNDPNPTNNGPNYSRITPPVA